MATICHCFLPDYSPPTGDKYFMPTKGMSLKFRKTSEGRMCGIVVRPQVKGCDFSDRECCWVTRVPIFQGIFHFIDYTPMLCSGHPASPWQRHNTLRANVSKVHMMFNINQIYITPLPRVWLHVASNSHDLPSVSRGDMLWRVPSQPTLLGDSADTSGDPDTFPLECGGGGGQDETGDAV